LSATRNEIEAEKARREAERRLAGAKMLLERQPQSKHELRDWFEGALGYEFRQGEIVFSDRSYQDGHTVPIDWLYELYCLGNGMSDDGGWRELTPRELNDRPKSYLLHANRGGMKTLGMAAFWYTLNWWIPNYSAVHSAAEKVQAQKCIEYIRDNWAASPLFSDKVKANTEKATFANGSILYLVTASVAGFNAPHTIGFSCDEVELIKPEVLNQGYQIPQKQVGRNLPSLIVLGSTQKQPNLTMSKLIAECKRGEHRYIIWNAFDVVERCPDWRTEKLPAQLKCSDFGPIAEQLEVLERKQRIELNQTERELVTRLTEQRDALIANCPLVADCRGLAKLGSGHYSIDDILKALKSGRSVFEAEVLCKKPSMQGAVYELYGPENESLDAIYKPGLKVVGTADYGFSTDPAAGNLIAFNGPYCDVFHEVHAHNVFSRDQAKLYRRLSERFLVQYWIVDRTAKELIRYMRDEGLAVVPSQGSIKSGIEQLALLICNGEMFRSLRINPAACPETCLEIVSYKRSPATGEPLSNQPDHHCDGLRYFAYHLMLHRRILNTTVRPARRAGRSFGAVQRPTTRRG